MKERFGDEDIHLIVNNSKKATPTVAGKKYRVEWGICPLCLKTLEGCKEMIEVDRIIKIDDEPAPFNWAMYAHKECVGR